MSEDLAAEIARLRQEASDNRLAASVEAGERRRAHARVAELEAEVARLRKAPLAALDADTPPTVPQVQALADAMWQVLDDMGANSRSVCPATKARARVAYEPFRFTDDNGDDGLDMPLGKAEAILAEI